VIVSHPRNYARNLLTGQYVFFWGDDFSPRQPELWAAWARVRAAGVHVIGEAPEVYGLRQVAARGTSSEQGRARKMLATIERLGLPDWIAVKARTLAFEALRFSSRRGMS
jgi:hypothetical protein